MKRRLFHRHKWAIVGFREFSPLTRMFLLVDSLGEEAVECACGATGTRDRPPRALGRTEFIAKMEYAQVFRAPTEPE